MILCSLNGCGRDVHIPDNYVASEEYWDKNGAQDYTDFCIYQYDSSSAIEADSSYVKVADSDIDRIKGYFFDFKQWMEVENRLDEYTFDESCISAGDYCLIKTKEGQPIGSSVYGAYDNYSVYYFDTESLVLYYIHSNI